MFDELINESIDGIFMEATENTGLLITSYRHIPNIVEKFLNHIIEISVDLHHGKNNINSKEIDDMIHDFKIAIDMKKQYTNINIDEISKTKSELLSLQKQTNELLVFLGKLKKNLLPGTNFFDGILYKSKNYTASSDVVDYEQVNSSIRSMTRAADWIEKIVIDLFNLIDQDLNILTIISYLYTKESMDSPGWIEDYISEDIDEVDLEETKPKEEPETKSLPKQTDAKELDKNGVRRKQLYIEFILWAKEYNPKNTFGSIFDKDAFNVTYPFIPKEMRYFYRLANPMLCVLAGGLTFFAIVELRKLNSKNSRLNEMMIFAATENDLRIFNKKDKKIYLGLEENGMLKLDKVLGETFDTYIQNMIGKGDILTATPTE